MTRNRKIEKYQNPPPKSSKTKGLVSFGRTTFIDKIIRNAESQTSVGFQTLTRKRPTVVPREAGSPSAPYAEIHSQIGGSEQSFQVITNLHSNPLQEGKSCNLKEGEGETSGTTKARPQLSKQGSPVITDLGSAAKPTRISTLR